MEKFKAYVTIEAITSSLIFCRPLARNLEITQLIIKNSKILKLIFGKKAFKIYRKMKKEDKDKAIIWFETSGADIASMYGAELWENWNGNDMFKFDLTKLKKLYPYIYFSVAKNIMTRVYKNHTGKSNIVSKESRNDPIVLSEIIKHNAGSNN